MIILRLIRNVSVIMMFMTAVSVMLTELRILILVWR